MKDNRLFSLCVDKKTGVYIWAAEVTEDSIEELCSITKGEHGRISQEIMVESKSKKPRKIVVKKTCIVFMDADPNDENVAEIGDYILTDGAGNYRILDKEVFEMLTEEVSC